MDYLFVPGIGDLVLFKVDQGCYRPLLITALDSDGRVIGTLFLSQGDSLTEWVRKFLHQPALTAQVQSRRGDGLGEWKPKPQPSYQIKSGKGAAQSEG